MGTPLTIRPPYGIRIYIVIFGAVVTRKLTGSPGSPNFVFEHSTPPLLSVSSVGATQCRAVSTTLGAIRLPLHSDPALR